LSDGKCRHSSRKLCRSLKNFSLTLSLQEEGHDLFIMSRWNNFSPDPVSMSKLALHIQSNAINFSSLASHEIYRLERLIAPPNIHTRCTEKLQLSG
jgi:hypothetical protein